MLIKVLTILDCGISLRNTKWLTLYVEHAIKEISLILVAKALGLIKYMINWKQEAIRALNYGGLDLTNEVNIGGLVN